MIIYVKNTIRRQICFIDPNKSAKIKLQALSDIMIYDRFVCLEIVVITIIQIWHNEFDNGFYPRVLDPFVISLIWFHWKIWDNWLLALLLSFLSV